jgi:hypothetical protein
MEKTQETEIKVIWKYELEWGGGYLQKIRIPRGADLLTVQEREFRPMLWAIVNPGAEEVERTLVFIGVNEFFSPDMAKPSKASYLGTVHNKAMGSLWHVFDQGET